MNILKIFNTKKYNAVLIGLGRIGFSLGFDKKREQPASHTMAFLDNSKINVIAGIDTDIQKCNEWKDFLSTKKVDAEVFYSSKEFYESEFFEQAEIDIIVVAVNENAHLEECIKAIQSKPKIVILEKPVALNTDEAEKIKKAAEENNVAVMVNHERRFSADYLKAKEFLMHIGEIQNVRAELNSGLRVYAKQFEKDGSYSLLHDGTHLVDIVSFLLEGKIEIAELENLKIVSKFNDEDGITRNFTAICSTKNIHEIEIKMSGRSKFFSFDVEILGTLGKICIGNCYAKFYERSESKLYTGFYSLENANVKVPKKTGYFSNMIQNAIDYLDKKAELISPLDDALEDLKILEKIKEQL